MGKFCAALVQSHKLRPWEVAELTLPEALLYAVDVDGTRGQSVSLSAALRKGRVLSGLSVEHYLSLARIRAGRP